MRDVNSGLSVSGQASSFPTGLRLGETLLHAALLVALLAVVFPGVFLKGEVIAPGDILFQAPPWKAYAPEGWERPRNRLMSDVVTAFYPYYAVSLHAIENGEWPLWNPFELAGMPLLANCQSAVLYPPRLLQPLLGLRWGTTAYILVKLWLCGMTAYLCGRLMRLRPASARFLSVGWMLASYNLIWCNWSLPDVSAWLPVLFLGVERVLDGRYRLGFFAVALGGALALLAGHPETAFTMGLGLGMYFILRLVFERRTMSDSLRAVGVCGAAWGFALAVSAAQLLPFLEYLANSSTFMDRAGELKATWLPAGVSLVFWVPRFFGTSAEMNYWGGINSNLYSMVYPGMAVWGGVALLVPAMRRNRREKARVVALIAASLGCLALAFDMYPISVINRLPVVSSLVFAYHAAFPIFALPMLGAIAVDRWFEAPRRPRSLLWALGLAAIVALLATYLMSFFGPLIRGQRLVEYVRFQLIIAALFGVGSLALYASRCRFRTATWPVAGLIVLLACDLLYANRGLNPTMPAEQVFPDTALTRFLQEQPQPCRVGVGEGNIASGLVAVYGIEEWLGYDGLYPERIIRFQQTLKENVWKAMEPACAIDLYLHDPRFDPVFPSAKFEDFERLGEFDGLEVYKNTRAFPRAFLIGEAEAIEHRDKLFARLADPAFDPSKTAVLERLPRTPLPETALPLAGTARVIERRATRCVIETEATTSCILVLADAYYPGWRVRIDGVPAEIFPVYYIFRGVVLPEGSHTVEFSYFPTSLRAGLVVSGLALLAGLVLALRGPRAKPAATSIADLPR